MGHYSLYGIKMGVVRNLPNYIDSDKIVKAKLKELGINVLILWECELKQNFSSCINKIIMFLDNPLEKKD